MKAETKSILEVYTRYGTAENAVRQMIDRRISESLERVFGQFTADTAIQKRAELGAQFSAQIRDAIGPVEIVSVQIENFSFSDGYEKNVAEKMTQEVEVKKLEQKALQAKITADITVTNARAEADANLARATASAEGVRLQGEAEASAIKAKSDALRESPNLVELTKAERWDGKLPTSFVPGSTIPFVNIK
ncbi:SPFH domain-containing protein [Phyllobacterium myrsinacearum]|uniref:Regulator of protease activity HflC (Stomatin/prohibitin superfamily) n=1 Tax=Phyllobacterium myrsinacearum TaxID=28101 RepID=A0A839ERU0_9HYPH|nr:regulator of protease activity HflC (stomatin/prohibitin superfamily) [Phyllobacterium myrsinacearum]